jgi:ankyrin repeat protein
LLIDRGAEVNRHDSLFGYTPLHHAAEHGDVELVKLLLASKADRSAKDNHGETPLDMAKRRDNKDVVKLLESAKE